MKASCQLSKMWSPDCGRRQMSHFQILVIIAYCQWGIGEACCNTGRTCDIAIRSSSLFQIHRRNRVLLVLIEAWYQFAIDCFVSVLKCFFFSCKFPCFLFSIYTKQKSNFIHVAITFKECSEENITEIPAASDVKNGPF